MEIHVYQTNFCAKAKICVFHKHGDVTVKMIVAIEKMKFLVNVSIFVIVTTNIQYTLVLIM